MKKTAVITVTGEGQGIQEALAMTERVGCEADLGKKNVLHLRLLAEELFGMLRGIAGGVEASYWLETEGKNFEIKMQSTVRMTIEMREQFLAASKSGKNEAARGFMGKIRVMIGSFLLSAKEALPYAMINSAAAMPMGGYAGESSAAARPIDRWYSGDDGPSSSISPSTAMLRPGRPLEQISRTSSAAIIDSGDAL